MREIKFRAWVNGRMIQVADVDFVNGEACGLGFDIQEAEDMTVFSNNLLEQYTGLKDKNGKEIYEGDIVEAVALHNSSFMKINQKEIDEVSFSCGSFYIKGYASCAPWFSLDVEVIGNIHENPELLA